VLAEWARQRSAQDLPQNLGGAVGKACHRPPRRRNERNGAAERWTHNLPSDDTFA
jgi:hypothetical protein